MDTGAALGAGATTLFTITNTSRYPQIAHVTVWTDWAYPVLGFNLFLTGYDVQRINLFDVIVRGLIFRTEAGTDLSNPNFLTFSGERNAAATCALLPRALPPDLVNAVENALTVGVGYIFSGFNCGFGEVGSNSGRVAKGYVTIDVVSTCTAQMPTDARGTYFAGFSSPLLFDNVLLGDYQQLGSTQTFDAQSSAMVHIRSIPEGGLSGAAGGEPVPTPLPYTFYDRYTPAGFRAADRRQPLPSKWSARYIQGGVAGFTTDFKIWREGVTAGLPTCYSGGTVRYNSAIAATDIVRFDEHENAFSYVYLSCPCAPVYPNFPAASRRSTANIAFPYITSSDLGGWMYMNLSSGSIASYSNQQFYTLSAQRAGFGPYPPGTNGSRTTTQNWVVVSMYGAAGANRLSVDFDASWLGNGCTPEAAGRAVIAPSTQPGGALVCPTDKAKCSPGTKPAEVNP